MDIFKKANVRFVTAWDINARKYVKVDSAMKKKARKIARKNIKKELDKSEET